MQQAQDLVHEEDAAEEMVEEEQMCGQSVRVLEVCSPDILQLTWSAVALT
jgi:hypothetical protein